MCDEILRIFKWRILIGRIPQLEILRNVNKTGVVDKLSETDSDRNSLSAK